MIKPNKHRNPLSGWLRRLLHTLLFGRPKPLSDIDKWNAAVDAAITLKRKNKGRTK